MLLKSNLREIKWTSVEFLDGEVIHTFIGTISSGLGVGAIVEQTEEEYSCTSYLTLNDTILWESKMEEFTEVGDVLDWFMYNVIEGIEDFFRVSLDWQA